MSFLSACSLARIYAISGRQLGTGFVARTHQQQVAACSSSSSVQPKEPPKTPSASPAENVVFNARTHRPNDFEKRLLVFTKKYKSKDEVPQYINEDVMERCRNQVRIKIANYMMVATAIGCIIMIFAGKKAQERGESVQKMNLDWHREYNEKAQKEMAETSKNWIILKWKYFSNSGNGSVRESMLVSYFIYLDHTTCMVVYCVRIVQAPIIDDNCVRERNNNDYVKCDDQECVVDI